MLCLVDVSDRFYCFCSGRGKGESGATGRGGVVGLLLKIQGGGGGSPGRGGGRGVERVSAANWGIGGGGGAKYFLSGPKRPPSMGQWISERELKTIQINKEGLKARFFEQKC